MSTAAIGFDCTRCGRSMLAPDVSEDELNVEWAGYDDSLLCPDCITPEERAQWRREKATVMSEVAGAVMENTIELANGGGLLITNGKDGTR